MSIYATASHIRSWLDGYAAIRQRAGEQRGWIELDTDAPDRRWPRTIGLDVIVIASFVDEAITSVAESRIAGTARRWSSCKGDLEREALAELSETYAGNRAFWSCLGDVFAQLSQLRRPLPSAAAWASLLEHIGAVDAAPLARDAPPVWFASAASLDALSRAQNQYLAALRGFDRVAPLPSMTGGVMVVPRSTNAEILQLAAFWTSVLRISAAKRANGYATIAARWRAVLNDVEDAARRGAPDAVYRGNHAFWRTVASVARHVAAAVAFGLTDTELRDAIEGQLAVVRNGPPSQDEPPVWFTKAKDQFHLFHLQKDYLAEFRGSDRLAPEPEMAGGVRVIPRSTVGDVLKLNSFWRKAIDSEKSKNAWGYTTALQRLNAATGGLAALASSPEMVYPQNHAFWRAVENAASHAAASDAHGMTNSELWRAGVGEHLDTFSRRVKEVAAAVKDVTVSAATAAGQVVNAGARGLVGELATPLLIGGGVLAAFLLLRRDSSEG